MINLTQHERIVVFFVIGVITVGSAFNAVFKKYPELLNVVSLLDQPGLLPKIDLNRADADELMRIPGVGAVIAQRIIDHRTKNGPFRKIAEINQIKGISKNKYERISPYLTVRSLRSSAFRKNNGALPAKGEVP